MTKIMRGVSTGFELIGVAVIVAGFALSLWRAGAAVRAGRRA